MNTILHNIGESVTNIVRGSRWVQMGADNLRGLLGTHKKAKKPLILLHNCNSLFFLYPSGKFLAYFSEITAPLHPTTQKIKIIRDNKRYIEISKGADVGAERVQMGAFRVQKIRVFFICTLNLMNVFKDLLFRVQGCSPKSIRSTRFLRGNAPICTLSGRINYVKNRLYIVIYLLDLFVFKGKVEKALCLFCAGSRLWVFFQVGWSEAEKAKSLTAHNYKKCGKGIYRANKINGLQSNGLRKSVVRFGLIGCLVSDRGLQTYPPIKNSVWLIVQPHLLLSINCNDFQRGFYKGLGQSFVQRDVFGFRKVGGAGGA